MEKPISVEEFIENSSIESQPILNELRAIVKFVFPDIEEKIGYGVLQYKYKNTNLGMSIAKKHVTLGFDFGVISDEVRKQLEKQGYKLGLQTLQIKFTQDIPRVEIQKLFDTIISNG